MNTLPIEIIYIILEFQGYHTYRNNKYIKRISYQDQRYNILKQIPKLHIIKNIQYGKYVTITKKIGRKEMFLDIQSYIVGNYIVCVVNIHKYSDNNHVITDHDRIQFVW